MVACGKQVEQSTYRCTIPAATSITVVKRATTHAWIGATDLLVRLQMEVFAPDNLEPRGGALESVWSAEA